MKRKTQRSFTRHDYDVPKDFLFLNKPVSSHGDPVLQEMLEEEIDRVKANNESSESEQHERNNHGDRFSSLRIWIRSDTSFRFQACFGSL